MANVLVRVGKHCLNKYFRLETKHNYIKKQESSRFVLVYEDDESQGPR